MKSFRFMLMATLLLASTLSAPAQEKKFICDYDKYANRHNANNERNALLDSACNEINRGKLQSAFLLLNRVAAIDSTATGEPDAYVDNQREKVLAYMEEAAEQGVAPENPAKEEPAVAPAPEVASTPAKEEEQPVSSSVHEETPVAVKEETPVVAKEENPEPVKEHVEPVKEPEPVASSGENPPAVQEETPEPVVASTPAEEAKPDKSFTEEELKEFQGKGLQKVTQLEGFLKQIGSKNTNSGLAQDAIDNALQLFDSEDRTVQVSSVKTPDKPRYKVRKYLDKLRLLNYDNVDIEWAELQYTSDFFKGKDENYHAYVVFRQRFTATKDNQIAYSDITTKKTEIILKRYQKAIEGVDTENWDVFLGDISVEQTETN